MCDCYRQKIGFVSFCVGIVVFVVVVTVAVVFVCCYNNSIWTNKLKKNGFEFETCIDRNKVPIPNDTIEKKWHRNNVVECIFMQAVQHSINCIALQQLQNCYCCRCRCCRCICCCCCWGLRFMAPCIMRCAQKRKCQRKCNSKRV